MDDLIKLQYNNRVSDNQNTIGPWLDTVLKGKGQSVGSFPELPDTFKIW
jgi:hypothetical protein